MDIPEQVTLRNNELAKQFEWNIGGKIAKVVYDFSSDKKRIFLTHTEVPPALEGKGIASKLVQAVLEYIEAKGWKLVPYCPYVQSYIKRHPEYRRLLDKGISL
jgi:predicted GNAT family acetyltransferase